MQLVPVKKPPSRSGNCEYKNIRGYINEFMRMNQKYVRVDYEPHEFANIHSAYGSIHKMIKRFNYPVKVSVVNGEVYLTRTDKEAFECNSDR